MIKVNMEEWLIIRAVKITPETYKELIFLINTFECKIDMNLGKS